MKNSRKAGFIDFTKNLWVQEVTSDSMGTTFYLEIKQVFELDELYYKIKYKYDILFKELDLENGKVTKILFFVLLLISISLNVILICRQT